MFTFTCSLVIIITICSSWAQKNKIVLHMCVHTASLVSLPFLSWAIDEGEVVDGEKSRARKGKGIIKEYTGRQYE